MLLPNTLHMLASVIIGFSPLLEGDGVASFPLPHIAQSPQYRFSPLLEGDGVASTSNEFLCAASTCVSVPFSRGTVLLPLRIRGAIRGLSFKFQSPSRGGRCCFPFTCALEVPMSYGFSPLLEGDGVASTKPEAERRYSALVSVPFSRGTVLLPAKAIRARYRSELRFQSPSRGGRCCFRERPILLNDGIPLSFSPLLEGDGVASND